MKKKPDNTLQEKLNWLQAQQNSQKLTAAGIGKKVAKTLGRTYKPRTEANLYGFFRRAERTYPSKRIAVLAKILGCTETDIININEAIRESRRQVAIESSNNVALDTGFNCLNVIRTITSQMASRESLTIAEFLAMCRIEEIRRAEGLPEIRYQK